VVDIAGMGVAQGAEELEGQPLLLDVLEERPSAKTVVERAVEELADEVAVGVGLDDALESKGVGYIRECLALLCASSARIQEVCMWT
jgi:hypothetical protein